MLLSRKTIFKSIALVIIFTIFALMFLIAYAGKASEYFIFLKYVPGGDKTGHLVGLCVLSLATSWLFSFKQIGKVYIGILIVAIFITIEEFMQQLSPHRTFDLLDLTCNYIGIITATFIIRFFKK